MTWSFDIGPYRTSAERVHLGTTTTVDLEDDGISIEVESGSQYMREHLSTFIPFEVLKRMFEARGHMLVTKPVVHNAREPQETK